MQDISPFFPWLRNVLMAALDAHQPIESLPEMEEGTGSLLTDPTVGIAEQLAMLLAIAPLLDSNFFASVVAEYKEPLAAARKLCLSEHTSSSQFLPTVNTLFEILPGTPAQKRVTAAAATSSVGFLIGNGLLRLEYPSTTQVPGTEILIATDLALRHLLLNEPLRPEFSSSFPARPLTTHYTWDELVLPAKTNLAVREIEVWLEHANVLMQQWGDRPKIKRGFRALFHGPPGTGKSLTAALLGKGTGREVFRIDLSMVVSKYIGETEKNLARVLDMAEGKGWILFFDEADALFGKRTNVRDAHDRYANQEVSFLLQRIEDYDGLVILASNKKDNLDEAFTRRFQSIIHFPVPNVAERELLWANSLPTELELSPEVDLVELAKRYDIAGGSIINVVGYATLMALNDGHGAITPQHLRDGVVKEYRKEGRNI